MSNQLLADSKAVRSHTPGPWHVDSVMGDDPHEICATHPRDGAGNPEVLATVFCDPGKTGSIPLSEANANARLIAAAPTLLDALRKALRDSGCDGDLCGYEWHEMARKAISLAENGDD